jgi:hypothetical protein
MKTATLIAGVLLATPVLAAERLTDTQLDRITAGAFTIVDTSGRLGLAAAPANIGIFVNDTGQAGRLIDTLRVALTADGFTIVDTPGRLDIAAGPANIGIFVNDTGQAGRLIDTSGQSLR